MTHIIVKDIINSELGVSVEKGDKVFEAIDKCLRKQESVEVDFAGITVLIPAFLDSVIGEFYCNDVYTEEFLNKNLKVKNLDEDDIKRLNAIIKTAKIYYANKELYEKCINEVLYENY